MRRIHPAPYDFVSVKKLRRLPHIFAKVIELPFNSDADIFVQEGSDSLRFVVETHEFGGEITPHIVQIYPGVTKLVIGGGRNEISAAGGGGGGGLEFNRWRFRLPDSTRPELATAAYSNGEMVVTVPKEFRLVGGRR